MGELHRVTTAALLRALPDKSLGANQTVMLDLLAQRRPIPVSELVAGVYRGHGGGPEWAERACYVQIHRLRRKGFPIMKRSRGYVLEAAL